MCCTVPPLPSGGLNHSREPSKAEQAVIAWQKGLIPLDTCLRVIQPVIQKIAMRVSSGYSQQIRLDFVEDALTSLVMPRPRSRPRLEEFNPDRAPLEAWLKWILTNLWIDRLRTEAGGEEQKQVSLHKALEGEEGWTRPVHLADQSYEVDSASLDEVTPWSARDQALINSWPCKQRIAVLALSGLWVKCSSEQWEATVLEFEKLHQVTIPRPFPSDEVLALPTPSDRISTISGQLCINSNTLSQQWHRYRNMLEKLEYIQQLRNHISS